MLLFLLAAYVYRNKYHPPPATDNRLLQLLLLFLFSHSALLDDSFFILLVRQSFYSARDSPRLNDWGNEWMTQNSRQTGAGLTYHTSTPSSLPSLSLGRQVHVRHEQGTSLSCCCVCWKVWNAEEDAIHEWVAFVRELMLSHSLSVHCSRNICMHGLQSVCKINGLICGRLNESGRSHTLSLSPSSTEMRQIARFLLIASEEMLP